MSDYNQIFDEVKAELITDDIGYRRWRIEIDGTQYQVGLARRATGWKWLSMDGEGRHISQWPGKLKEFGDAMAAHFNKNATV